MMALTRTSSFGKVELRSTFSRAAGSATVTWDDDVDGVARSARSTRCGCIAETTLAASADGSRGSCTSGWTMRSRSSRKAE